MATEIYYLRAHGDRAEELLEAEEQFGTFAEAVDDDLHRRGGPPLPCLISFIQGKLTHSGTLYVGNKAAEGAKRVNVSKVEKLLNPIRSGAIVDLVPVHLKREVREQLRQSCLISGEAAAAVLDAIRILNPSLASEILRFELQRERVSTLPTNKKQALALEKEMLGTALSFTGMERKEIQDWSNPV